jgi:MFS family permease
MAENDVHPLDPGTVLYCVNHPHTETLIRCNKCLDPICPKCAVRTPVGLRCKKCARLQRSPLYALTVPQVLLAALVSLAVGLVAGALVPRLGLLFVFFLAPTVGGLSAEAVARSLHGKRGRALQVVVALAILVGAMGGPWLWQAVVAGSLAALPSNPLAYLASLVNLGAILYLVLAIGAAVARLR